MRQPLGRVDAVLQRMTRVCGPTRGASFAAALSLS